MNLIQYEDKPIINLDHVRLLDLIISSYNKRPVCIRFTFANGDESEWWFSDEAETIKLYEKLQAICVHHV